jgi:heme/copper-type cytochrome/quinol oxidase subunit 2
MKNAIKLAAAFAIAIIFLFLPSSALACGSCYGAADSPATNGMNFAILSMIGITGGVLAMMTSFFLYLRKRAQLYLAADSEHPTNDDGGIH